MLMASRIISNKQSRYFALL